MKRNKFCVIAIAGLCALMNPVRARAICGVPLYLTDDDRKRGEEREFVESFNHALAVFSGEVIAADDATVRVKVFQVWKGALPSEVMLPSGALRLPNGTYSSMPEGLTLAMGTTYLIYASGTSVQDMRAIGGCGRLTMPLKDAADNIPLLDELKIGRLRSGQAAGITR